MIDVVYNCSSTLLGINGKAAGKERKTNKPSFNSKLEHNYIKESDNAEHV